MGTYLADTTQDEQKKSIPKSIAKVNIKHHLFF
jgi:hypothetical protein